MKKLTKFWVLCVAALFVCVDISAQESESWISTKKGTGIGYYDFYYALPDGDYDSTFGLGMRFCYGYNVIDNLFIQAGLGWQSGFVKVNDVTKNSTLLNLPMQVGYNLSLGRVCSLDIKTGPQLDYTIAGNIKYGDEKVKFKDMDGVKRFNAEYTVGASFLIKDWGIIVEYGVGLGENANGILRLGIVGRY